MPCSSPSPASLSTALVTKIKSQPSSNIAVSFDDMTASLAATGFIRPGMDRKTERL